MSTGNYKYILLFVICIAVACSSPRQTTESESPTDNTEILLGYQNSIQEGFLKQHVSVLADDSLEGRETGMPGQKKAAHYIAEQYRMMDLKAIGDNNTYFQKFDLNTTINDSIVFETFQFNNGGHRIIERSVASKKKAANYIRSFGGTDTLEGEIVFGGFGVNDTARSVNHLDGIDLSGKWVLVFQQIPHVADGDTLIDPAINERARFDAILNQRGAEGILIIPPTDVDQFQVLAKQGQRSFGTAGGMRLAYRDDGNSGSGGFTKGYNVINPAMAAQILGLENVEMLESYRSELLSNIRDFTARETGFGLRHIPYAHKKTIETENVLALLEGADPVLKNEVVVLSAHYDHVGIGQPDSTGDTIYNGANDDASGTAGVLGVARALADARDKGIRPRRSVMFLMVTGEEKGLLGSRFYSDHPVFSMENTVANINTDMIGRIDPRHRQSGQNNYIYIIGGDIISSELHRFIEKANSKSENLILDERYNDLNDPNQFYRRSDHWHFGRFGVPFVFFFNGVHEDYHQPSDEVEKMQFDLMARTVRTIYATTVLIANAEKAPGVDNQEFIKITREN